MYHIIVHVLSKFKTIKWYRFIYISLAASSLVSCSSNTFDLEVGHRSRSSRRLSDWPFGQSVHPIWRCNFRTLGRRKIYWHLLGHYRQFSNVRTQGSFWTLGHLVIFGRLGTCYFNVQLKTEEKKRYEILIREFMPLPLIVIFVALLCH